MLKSLSAVFFASLLRASFSHCEWAVFPGDFGVEFDDGFGGSFACRVVRALFWTCWLRRASATTSAWPTCLRLTTFYRAALACIAFSSFAFACLAFSSKKNLFIFSWFCLYSPNVLQATLCINLVFSTVSIEFVSVTIARSFLVMIVFFLEFLSRVIVWWITCYSSLWN